jgi:hypothetical protein
VEAVAGVLARLKSSDSSLGTYESGDFVLFVVGICSVNSGTFLRLAARCEA